MLSVTGYRSNPVFGRQWDAFAIEICPFVDGGGIEVGGLVGTARPWTDVGNHFPVDGFPIMSSRTSGIRRDNDATELNGPLGSRFGSEVPMRYVAPLLAHPIRGDRRSVDTRYPPDGHRRIRHMLYSPLKRMDCGLGI
jgi:hypothetical protein